MGLRISIFFDKQPLLVGAPSYKCEVQKVNSRGAHSSEQSSFCFPLVGCSPCSLYGEKKIQLGKICEIISSNIKKFNGGGNQINILRLRTLKLKCDKMNYISDLPFDIFLIFLHGQKNKTSKDRTAPRVFEFELSLTPQHHVRWVQNMCGGCKTCLPNSLCLQ